MLPPGYLVPLYPVSRQQQISNPTSPSPLRAICVCLVIHRPRHQRWKKEWCLPDGCRYGLLKPTWQTWTSRQRLPFRERERALQVESSPFFERSPAITTRSWEFPWHNQTTTTSLVNSGHHHHWLSAACKRQRGSDCRKRQASKTNRLNHAPPPPPAPPNTGFKSSSSKCHSLLLPVGGTAAAVWTLRPWVASTNQPPTEPNQKRTIRTNRTPRPILRERLQLKLMRATFSSPFTECRYRRPNGPSFSAVRSAATSLRRTCARPSA